MSPLKSAKGSNFPEDAAGLKTFRANHHKQFLEEYYQEIKEPMLENLVGKMKKEVFEEIISSHRFIEKLESWKQEHKSFPYDEIDKFLAQKKSDEWSNWGKSLQVMGFCSLCVFMVFL